MTENKTAIRLISLSKRLQDQLRPHQVDDLINATSPDAIVLSSTNPEPEAFSEMSQKFSVPCLYPAGQRNDDIKTLTINGIDLVWMKDYNSLFTAASKIKSGEINTDTPTFYITTDIDVKIQPTKLKATLENKNYYVGFYDQSPGNPVFLSTKLDANYEKRWDGMLVRGISPIDADLSALIPVLKLYNNGLISVNSIRNSRLGIRAIDSVGRKTADKLVDNGYETFKDIATTPKADFKMIRGIGKKTAETIQPHAKALAYDKIVRKTLDPLPGDAPIFISIETDGAKPTVIWQISVLDSKCDEYHCFMHNDPNDKERVIGDFLDWYMRNGKGQMIVSWSGWDFDFKHIDRFTRKHADFFLDVWEKSEKLSLKEWAIGEDNAILPSRSPELETISESLGYERTVAELGGQRVAAIFREWVRAQNENLQPNWELYEKYGKDNVESLRYVYDEIDEVSPSRGETMISNLRSSQ